jgi:signal transduction histidine kinase
VLTLFLGAISLLYLRGQTSGFSAFFAFLTVAVGFAISGVSAALLRSKRLTQELGYVQIFVDQALWTGFVYITGGVTSGGVSLYGLTCVIGGIVLGRRGTIAAFSAAGVFYAALSVALVTRTILPPPDQTAAYAVAWGQISYPVFANLSGLAIVAALAGYLSERLRVTGGDLAIAQARAEQAEQLALLGKLAAGLAHEIRNPLGSIAGSIELLKTSPNLSDEDRSLCDIMQREALRLNDLVGDMVDLSRSRAPQRERIDLAETAREVVTLAKQTGRGRDVLVSYQGVESAVAEGDSGQIRQVIWNLVRNAVSVSPPGATVSVAVEKRPNGGIALSVRDVGPGIPAESRPRIFDAFFTTRSHGTGVGLAVVKRILDAHRWSIEIDSSASGTTFRVVVPKTKSGDRWLAIRASRPT